MRYNKQDLPKIVVLSIVLISLAVYIGISYSRLSQQYKRQKAEHVAMHERQRGAAQSATGGVAANQGMQMGGQMSATVQALLTPVSPPDRDPFNPVIAPLRTFVSAPTRAPNKPRGATTTREPLVLPPLADGAAGQPPFPKRGDTLALTGIVLGTPPLAVMRRGEDHFIVQQGEELPGKVRVQSITRTSVTLRDEKREYTLKLGQ